MEFAIADLSLFPYYAAIIETYADFGVAPGDITAVVLFAGFRVRGIRPLFAERGE